MADAFQASPTLRRFADRGLLRRLPVTFSTSLQDRIKDWVLLFPAERSYFERLAALLDRLTPEELDELFAALRETERAMGVNTQNWPAGEFSLAHVDFLNRNPHYPEWRKAVADVFARIDPIVDAEVARAGKARLAIILSPAELPVGPDRMWLRVAERGKRIPLQWPEGDPDAVLPPLVRALLSRRPAEPYDAWVIEAGRRFSTEAATCLSYEALEPYRQRLSADVRTMVESQSIRGPRQLGERLRQMRAGESPFADALLADFARSILLNGNGTLLLNNTFVEWASVQAVRRARPRVTVTSFGVRNKVKPFSSLLIYTDQETATPVPTQQDTLGSYVDLELFYLYLWQEFEKYPEFRRNTAYLLVGEGMDEMLAIAPPDFPLLGVNGALTPSALMEHCGAWLGVHG